MYRLYRTFSRSNSSSISSTRSSNSSCRAAVQRTGGLAPVLAGWRYRGRRYRGRRNRRRCRGQMAWRWRGGAGPQVAAAHSLGAPPAPPPDLTPCTGRSAAHASPLAPPPSYSPAPAAAPHLWLGAAPVGLHRCVRNVPHHVRRVLLPAAAHRDEPLVPLCVCVGGGRRKGVWPGGWNWGRGLGVGEAGAGGGGHA